MCGEGGDGAVIWVKSPLFAIHGVWGGCCMYGTRLGIGHMLLQSAGLQYVVCMCGGLHAWQRAGRIEEHMLLQVKLGGRMRGW